MNDLEENEVRLLRKEEEMGYLDSLVTPAVAQIMSKNGAIFSVDYTKGTVIGVEICTHAGNPSKYFVSVTVKFPEYLDTGDEWRVAHLNCVHRYKWLGGATWMDCKRFAASLMYSNDYLNKDDWVFNT